MDPDIKCLRIVAQKDSYTMGDNVRMLEKGVLIARARMTLIGA